MRLISATFAGFVALSAVSTEAASIPATASAARLGIVAPIRDGCGDAYYRTRS
jgi:hypothetical protein